jgi:hypothetical protein
MADRMIGMILRVTLTKCFNDERATSCAQCCLPYSFVGSLFMVRTLYVGCIVCVIRGSCVEPIECITWLRLDSAMIWIGRLGKIRDSQSSHFFFPH